MDLRKSSEAELLGLMANQSFDPDGAHAAWTELYGRHVKYVFVVVGRSYARALGGRDGVTDVVVDTFQRAFQWAGRQKEPSAVTAAFIRGSPDGTRRAVLAWLCVIANGLVKDRLRRNLPREEDLAQAEEQQWRGGSEPSNQAPSEESVCALKEALASLSPREAEALHLSLPWYDPHAGAFSVPAGEASAVAERLGITPELLRQRRHRALKHLRTFLSEVQHELPGTGGVR